MCLHEVLPRLEQMLPHSVLWALCCSVSGPASPLWADPLLLTPKSHWAAAAGPGTHISNVLWCELHEVQADLTLFVVFSLFFTELLFCTMGAQRYFPVLTPLVSILCFPAQCSLTGHVGPVLRGFWDGGRAVPGA